MPFSRRTDPNFLPAAGNVRAFAFKRHFFLQNVICWYHIMFKAGFQPCSGPFSVFHVKHVSRETGKRPPRGGLFPYQPGKAVYAKPSDPPHTGPKGDGGRGKGKQKWKRKALPLRGGWSAEYLPRRLSRRFESSLHGLSAQRFIQPGQSDGLTRGFLPLPARALGSAPHIQCSPHGPARRRSRLRRRSSW